MVLNGSVVTRERGSHKSSVGNIRTKRMFLLTHETHEALCRPIPICAQVQQKHWKCNTRSFAQCIYSSWKNRLIWILFIGFSSAFNTMQPYLLTSKLLKLDFNPRLILWIVNFLVNHSQTVYHQTALLSSCSISIGSPHGIVLSPILLYTGTDTTPIIKYWQFCNRNPSNSDSVYFAEVEKFSNWFRDNSLDLNVKKTKEMLTDFRKALTVISYLFIDGMKVERVNTNI